MTASVILTPRFAFCRRRTLSFAVDYFDIKVKGEISELGAADYLFGCYDSPDLPNDPLCSLFTRGTGFPTLRDHGDHDRYINIASQESKGLDFTALIQQGLGRWGSLTLLGNATYQLKDTDYPAPWQSPGLQ